MTTQTKKIGIIEFVKIHEAHRKRVYARMQEDPNHQKYLEDNFLSIHGEEKLHNVAIPLTKAELFESELMHKIDEIYDCIARIEEIGSIYLLKRKSKVKLAEESEYYGLTTNSLAHKCKVLKLRYEHYICEMFMLEERVRSLLKWIRRKYNKSVDKKILTTLIAFSESYLDVVKKAFEGVREVRNEHVHNSFYDDDKLSVLERLASSAFIFKIKTNDEDADHIASFYYQVQFEKKYHLIRKEHFKLYNSTAKQMTEFLDTMLVRLFAIIYNQDKIKLPF